MNILWIVLIVVAILLLWCFVGDKLGGKIKSITNQKYFGVVILFIVMAGIAYFLGQNSSNNKLDTNGQQNSQISNQQSSQPVQTSKTKKQTTQSSQPTKKITLPDTQTQQTQKNSYPADTLYENLSPRLAYITCYWYNKYRQVLFSKSSNGLLGPMSTTGSYFINTVLGGVSRCGLDWITIVPGLLRYFFSSCGRSLLRRPFNLNNWICFCDYKSCGYFQHEY